MNKRKFPVWVIVVIVVGALVASKYIFFPKKDDKVSGKGRSGGGAISVSYHVARDTVFSNRITAAGQVGAFNQVDLVPEVAGRVVSINFKEGETVKAGAVLVKLNDADLQAQLVKTRTQLRLSQQKLDRVKRLLEVEGVSREEFEMQENEVAALKADEHYLLAQIAKTNIVAPFSGVVGLRLVSEGAYVSATTPVVSIVQMKPVYIEFSVPERYHTSFREGQIISFSADNVGKASTFTASVYAIEPRVDEATKSIRARARYSGEKAFYPGSFVNVEVELGREENTIMVPTQCVIPTIDGQKIFTVRNGTATEVPVDIGLRTDKEIQVTSGIRVGDTIVASGLLGIKQGMKVQLINQVK